MEINNALANYIEYCSNYRRLSSHTIRAYKSDLLDYFKTCKISSWKDINEMSFHAMSKYYSDCYSCRTTIRKVVLVNAFIAFLNQHYSLTIRP